MRTGGFSAIGLAIVALAALSGGCGRGEDPVVVMDEVIGEVNQSLASDETSGADEAQESESTDDATPETIDVEPPPELPPAE
jgi:hypothetical protein